MHRPVRLAVPLTAAALLGAAFPASAAAAAPVATVGSDLVPALVIAGAGALAITLIMVLVPAARRGPGSASSAPAPAPSAFRARPLEPPVNHPAGAAEREPARVTGGRTEPEPPPLTDGRTEPEPPPLTDGRTEPEPPPLTDESIAHAPVDTDRPAAERTRLHPGRLPSAPATSPLVSTEPAGADEALAASPHAVALADPPVPAPASVAPPHAAPAPMAAASVASAPAAPASAEPAPQSPAPDLLAAFSPEVVLGDGFDPARLRRTLADGIPEPPLPESGVRALLRDHSLVVPIAACVLVGVTVQLVRARRRG